MPHKKVDAVAAARARDKRVKKALKSAKTGVGKGMGALKALKKKAKAPRKGSGY